MKTTRAPQLWLAPEGDLPRRASGPAWGAWLVLLLLTLAFGLTFSWLSVVRHLAFQSHAFDLGNMDQAVWNTLHGNLLRFTDMQPGSRVLTSRLAIHVEPLLILLAPAYMVHSGPETLLVIQAWVVALGAIPAYLLANRWLARPRLALVFPAAYLLHPSLQNAVLDDFHAVTLSACFLLWALYFAWTDGLRGYAIFATLAAATKEEVGLLIAMLGFLLLLRRRYYAAFMSIVGGVGWTVICMTVIIPAFNPGGHSPYLYRYAYLGHGLAGIAATLLHHPLPAVRVLTSSSRQAYLAALLQPVGWLSLLGLPLLLVTLPTLLINMLSTDPTMYSGFYQYSAEIVPFVIAAAALGTSWLTHVAIRWRGGKAIPVVLGAVVLVASLSASRVDGFSPLADCYLVPSAGPHQALEDRLLQLIPRSAVVAAADEIEPHLSERPWIYLLPTVHPTNGPAATYLVLDASIASLPVTPLTLHTVAVRALHEGYGVVAASDGILVLRRGAPNTTLPSGFFSYIFAPGSRVTPQHVSWGPLHLTGLTLHPRSAQVNRARPSISLDTYWRSAAPLPARARITFYMSPVYHGRHPAFSRHWVAETDSPTWDWLPLARWPQLRTIRADSLPLLPPSGVAGKVDVAIGVQGLGASPGGDFPVAGAPTLVRVATVTVS